MSSTKAAEYLAKLARAAVDEASREIAAGRPKKAVVHQIEANAFQRALLGLQQLADIPERMEMLVAAEQAFAGDYIADVQKRMQVMGVSQAALVKASGLTAPQISRWFNTGMRPNLANVQRIEQALASLAKPKVQRERRKGPKKPT